jgi:hypothetical protein
MSKDWEQEVEKLWEAINGLALEVKGITVEMSYIRKGITWVIVLMAGSMGLDITGMVA